MTALRAIAFLAVYALWGYLAKRNNSPEQLLRKPLRTAAWNGLSFGIALSLFTGLHTGRIDFQVTLALVLLGQLSVLITLLIGSFLDFRQEVISACFRWGGVQLSSHNVIKALVFAPAILALVIYPIAVVKTIFYPTYNPMLFSVQSVTSFMFCLSVPPMLWVLWGILSSRYWREAARTSILLLFSSGAISSFLYFVVLLWSFNLSGSGSQVSAFGTPISYSPRILGLVVIGFLVCYLAPYLRGTFLGRQTVKNLHRERRDFLNRIIRVLKYPVVSDAEGALGMLREDMNAGIENYRKSDPVFGIAAALEDTSFKPKLLKLDREAYPIARIQDVRFEHLDWFVQLDGFVESARVDISEQLTQEEKRTKLAHWVTFFEQFLSELNDEIEAAPRGSALLVLGVVVSVTVGAIFSKAGEALWELLKDSLK